MMELAAPASAVQAANSTAAPMGYFVGRFPNACHTYFWREVSELRRRGVVVELCSTVHPGGDIAPHAWAAGAAAQTRYLFPLGLRDMLGALGALLGAGPQGWLRCAGSIRRADMPLRSKLRLVAHVLLGARLLALARRHGWRHMHSGFCGDGANTVLFAHLLGGVAYSLSLHDDLSTFGPNQREKWRHAAFGTVITELLRGQLVAALGQENLPPRLEIAPMGADIGQFTRTSPYIPWKGAGPLRLFFCGRIVPTKGVAELLESLARVRAAGIDAQLTIAGAPYPPIAWYLQRLEDVQNERQLRPHVRCLGKTSEETIRAELERAHLFCLASYKEGLGVSLMEAMAMGVPVLATAAGGVPELVRHGVDGLLVPPQEPGLFADAIVALARDPQLAGRLSAAGTAHVREHFHSGRSAGVMAACLEPPPRAPGA